MLEVLVGGLAPHVDHWLAETQSSLEEAKAVRQALDGDRRPIWFSFTLEDEAEDAAASPRLRSGEPVAAAATLAAELGAAALLFNCSQPEVMGPAIRTARETLAHLGAALEVGVYANAFPPQAKDAKANDGLDELRADLTPPAYLDWARRWVDDGASIVGGCCGIGPDHIARLAQALN
jgi:S-methylmethionine-dependent homocysteine/selenocysteine methylase